MTLRTVEGQLFAGEHRVLKGWESFSGWFWFGTEQVEPGIWFGFIQGTFEEWGYFDEQEMAPLIKQGLVWRIKECDLPYAGRRTR